MKLSGWATAPALPAWLLVTGLHPRLRRDLRARWGTARSAVQPGSVWIHASSVGEVGAVHALLPHLPRPVLCTTDTDTGTRVARRLAEDLPGVVAQVRPVDHPWVLAPLWSEARPRALIFTEGAFWPALAALARRSGVPVLRVSARAGPRTRRLAPAARLLAAATDLVVARDEGEAQWFRAQGAPVVVGGDLKSDRPTVPTAALSRPFLAGASTRAGDEVAVLEALSQLPGWACLLAPRDVARAGEVVALARDRGLRVARRTDLGAPVDVDVLVLDTMGELAALLHGARAALVGGTFDAALGGHSAAEARAAGVPVVAGPHVWANAASFAGVCRVAAVEEVPAALVEAALGPRPEPSCTGAGARTWAHIEPWIGRPGREVAPRPWATGIARMWDAGDRLKRGRQRRRQVRLDVPVVSVGSRNARGPGKTSTARWVARQLRARGHRVGVVVRGNAALCAPSDDPRELSDEGVLFAWDGHLVAAGPDRVAAARAAVGAGVSAIVLDDGLQLRSLHRDVELEVVDARFPGARGPLPAGERRPPVRARVDGVIAHHVSAAFPAQGWRAERRLGPWIHGDRVRPEGPSAPLAAFAGIGRPADFFAGLDASTRTRALRDHAPLDARRLRRLRAWADGRPLVCTAKDAARLPPELRADLWWRDLQVEVRGAPEAWFP